MTYTPHEITSHTDVYSHPTLRYLARQYAQRYLTPDDLLQEAAFAVWEFLQRREPPNQAYLLAVAKNAMRDASWSGASIDKPWSNYRRLNAPVIHRCSDLSCADGNEVDPVLLFGEDKRSSQFPAIVALRDLIERIYSYDGYHPTDKTILKALRAGLSYEEISGFLSLTPAEFRRKMRQLRFKVLMNVFGGRDVRLRDVDPDRLQLSPQEASIHRLLLEGLSHLQIARRMGLRREHVSYIARWIRSRQALVNLGLPPKQHNKDGKAANRAWI